jgi:hypothetical protein
MFRHYKSLLFFIFCVFLYACPFSDSPPKLAGIEYIDNMTIKVVVFTVDTSMPYEIKDNTLSVYSTKYDLYYRIIKTEKLSDTEYKCFLRRNLKSGDKLRINGLGSVSGSVYFDVPYKEQL